MGRGRNIGVVGVATLILVAAALGGCAADTPKAARAVTSTTAAFDPSKAGTVTITGPVANGGGHVTLAGGNLDLATVGYTESEYFIAGNASSYATDHPLTTDGRWAVHVDAHAPFVTRVVVRRPADAATFSGNVAVEWLNVSGGLDAAPDWTTTHVEMIRRGWAWVGVSAQSVGVEGGSDSVGGDFALKKNDPARYGTLSHPGDSFSYDMFSQAGAAVRTQPGVLLGGLPVKRVLAMGESQSAFRLSTYVNAVAPLNHIYDGYFIHSRAGTAAPLAQSPQKAVEAPEVSRVRTDLRVPVLVYSSESDLVGDKLGYAKARQPDSAWFRGWEVAGSSHEDAYGLGIGDSDDGSGQGDARLFAALTNPPAKVYGGVISCDRPINSGGQTYVLRAALRAMETWMATGTPPASMPPLKLEGTDYARDDHGIAIGGIRTPEVDVPIAALSGLGQSGGSFCFLFGTTAPFDATRLRTLYPDHAAFVADWTRAVQAGVAAKVMLDADARQLMAAATASTVGA